MPYPLKPISKEAIDAALEKAHLYRVLNEPADAESICLDILEADPSHQGALISLLLARTDQFDDGMNPQRAREILQKLSSEYDRAYYAGLVHERMAKAMIKRGTPGACYSAYEQLRHAMECFHKAEELRPPGHDDAILRWNACVRLLARHPELQPRPKDTVEAVLSE
ncbi:MAG: hypothetical protein HY235_07940 [Acidobacteria bacterium]|nr:hypothetical protein [Acidobacteriota bacterium]